MPETANVPLPAKLLKRGVRDIVRICDGRMSGTAYGTVVLHVAPEAAAGGPLALVRTGDWITLDVPARTLTLDVPDDELAARRAEWTPPPQPATRGWTWLYTEHVQQADTGCDLDFLTGASGAAGRPRPPLNRKVSFPERVVTGTRREGGANSLMAHYSASITAITLFDN